MEIGPAQVTACGCTDSCGRCLCLSSVGIMVFLMAPPPQPFPVRKGKGVMLPEPAPFSTLTLQKPSGVSVQRRHDDRSPRQSALPGFTLPRRGVRRLSLREERVTPGQTANPSYGVVQALLAETERIELRVSQFESQTNRMTVERVE
jgi:hypothetical protein